MKGFTEYNEEVIKVLRQNGFSGELQKSEFRDESVIRGAGFEISSNDVRIDINRVFLGLNETLYDVAKDLTGVFGLPVYVDGELQFAVGKKK